MRTYLIAFGLFWALIATAQAKPAMKGKWSDVFKTPNVMIHAHLLPNGKVLFWSRREQGQSLHPRTCKTRLWNPSLGTGPAAFSETSNEPEYNLFCAGHSFLPDGRLFAAGGHIRDGKGEPFASIYDPATDKWSKVPQPMKGGRWYPTVVTLLDGGVLVSFGSDEHGNPNTTQQVWRDGNWTDTQNFNNPPYYPRMHVAPDGRVFMSGPFALTQFLDVGNKNWQVLRPEDPDPKQRLEQSSRASNFRDYAPAVMFEPGKIVFIGGGNAPTKNVETVDLNDPKAKWKAANPMNFARRQHNATLLPDGTVFVTGGSQGNGGDTNGFDDLRVGQPIRSAELWNPKTDTWTKLAKASENRCYHSVAVLLPDATVLSAGGGEYSPKNDDNENDPKDTLHNAQVFSPPYLHTRNPRPDIAEDLKDIKYKEKFSVKTSNPDQIGQVSCVRLSSVTHSFNTHQRINFLDFEVGAKGLIITAPANEKVCPPGHYMLFLISNQNVPSVAKIVHISK